MEHSVNHNYQIKYQFVIILSLILIGLNLRPSIAAIGPLLPQIKSTLHLNFTEISLLTAMPILCMGIIMFISNRILRHINSFNLTVVALSLIGLSSFFRFFAAADKYNLLATAIIAGCGIAIIQAILPLIIKKNFPKNMAMYMGIYVTAIMGGAALSSSIVPVIENHFNSWQLSLSCWSVLAILAIPFCLYMKNILSKNTFETKKTGLKSLNLYSIPRAWILGIFFGLGTASYTCVLAWLPPYFMDLGWTNTQAGLLLAILTLAEVFAGLLFPALSNKNPDRRVILACIIFCCILGYLGLILFPESITYLWILLLGLGIGGLFPMSLILALDHLPSPEQANQLTSFVQGIGYTIACFSPMIAGLLRDYTGSFVISWISLIFTSLFLLVLVPIFNPNNYSKNMKIN